MQNMQIILYPKQLHYMNQTPINIRLVYKKVCISTNHELQKCQNRQSYPIKNSIANINTEVKFKLSKEFELNNTKIVIIVIGLKGRQISCLGDISLDLLALKQKTNSNGFYKAKLDKSKDAKAFLVFDIKFIEKTTDIKKNKKQHIPELGIIKTEYHYKEDLYISRRQKQDRPTAYQISRKNFKQTQIGRNNEPYQSLQKKSTGSTGSYKKRFQYEVNRLDKSRKKSVNKEIGSNYLKVYQKDKSPSPRMRTPEPIAIQTLRNGQTTKRIYKDSSTINRLDLSYYEHSKNHQLNEPDTFRGREYQSSTVSQNDSQKNSHTINYHAKTLNSISENLHQQKDHKYRTITEKLQMIENKIRRQKQRYDNNDNENGKYSPEIRKEMGNQIEQIDAYQISEQSRKTLPKRYEDNMSQRFNSNSPAKSIQDSTCPRNQKPPSPIQIAETPQINKNQSKSIKMSQFTINSKKNQLHSQQRSSNQNNQSNSQISKFQQIQQLGTRKQNINNKTLMLHAQNRESPYQEKRDLSPNFQKRKSELQLEKKNSIGTNYLQTQVKMLQLQIQTKGIEHDKLQKKLNKVQQENVKLTELNSQYSNRITELSNQLDEQRENSKLLKDKINELERQKSQLTKSFSIQASCFAEQLKGRQLDLVDNLRQRLKQKENELSKILRRLSQKQQQVSHLEEQVNTLNFYKTKYQNVYKQLNVERIQRGEEREKVRLEKQIEIKKYKRIEQDQHLTIKKMQEELNQLKKNNRQVQKKDQLQSQQNTIKNIKTSENNQSQYLQQIQNLKERVNQLQSNLQKKQKIVEKLSSVNQNNNEKIYRLQQQSNKRIQQLDQQVQQLLMKNMQAQSTIKELEQKVQVREKQVKQLQNQLANKQLNKNSQISKSQSIIKVRSMQENYEQKYQNQRKKCSNLESQLKFSQNRIKTLNLQLENLKLEKKDLQQQIDMIAMNNSNQLAKKSVMKKATNQNQSISESVKLQNKVLKQQIKLLQNQVKELNYLLDGAIQKTNNFEVSKLLQLQTSANPQADKNILGQKYIALVRRLQAYEHELRSKKNKMAEIINCVWRGGDAQLIDQIDRIMDLE